MTFRPLLTVVTVVRNDSSGLAATARSVAAQECPDAEHLIIDGASTDSTGDLARQIAESAPRTRTVSEPDAGIYDAMNKGVRWAQGRFIQFLNAGDVYSSPAELAVVCAQLSSPGTTWLRTRVRFVDADGAPTRPLAGAKFDARFVWGWQQVFHQGAFIETDLIRRHGGFDDSLAIVGDYDLMRRLWAAGARPVISERVTVDVDASGVSTLQWRRGYLEMHRVRSAGAGTGFRAASRADLGAHLAVVGAKRSLRTAAERIAGRERVSRLRGRS